jgi:hypothetical protein
MPDRLEPPACGHTIGAAQTRRGSLDCVAARRARRGRRRYALARPVGQSEERHRTGREVAWRSRVFALPFRVMLRPRRQALWISITCNRDVLDFVEVLYFFAAVNTKYSCGPLAKRVRPIATKQLPRIDHSSIYGLETPEISGKGSL